MNIIHKNGPKLVPNFSPNCCTAWNWNLILHCTYYNEIVYLASVRIYTVWLALSIEDSYIYFLEIFSSFTVTELSLDIYKFSLLETFLTEVWDICHSQNSFHPLLPLGAPGSCSNSMVTLLCVYICPCSFVVITRSCFGESFFVLIAKN